MANDNINLTPEDIIALSQMVYGENAGEDTATQKMTAQSAINRLRSGRIKEFGATIPEILQQGYYAVKDNTPLYQQAVSGNFPDISSKAKFSEIQKLIESIVADQDYGKAQFYFRPEEEENLRKNPKKFNFDLVKPQGQVGVYNTYSY